MAEQGEHSVPKRKQQGLVIHSVDGRLYPGFPGALMLPEYRPYHGDPKATHAERMRYLQGFQQEQDRAVLLEKNEFNIMKASREDLITYMLDEYGVRLDVREGDLLKLRIKAMEEISRIEGAASAPLSTPVPPPAEPRKTLGLK